MVIEYQLKIYICPPGLQNDPVVGVDESKDVCDDRFSFHSKSELMNEQCARRQRSWVQKVRNIGTTVFTLKMTWRNFDI